MIRDNILHPDQIGCICPVCNKPMKTDDVDFNFNGCFDKWMICDNKECTYDTTHYYKVRYKKIVSREKYTNCHKE